MGTEDLDVVDSLAQLAFLVQGALAERVSELEMSIVQARLLGVLRDRTPTMNELAGVLELDKSSITGLVGRAEKRGLVARAPSATDGRSTVVTLTTAGRRLVRTVAGRFAADIEALLGGLTTSERRTLAALASRVVVGQAAQRGADLFDTRRSSR